MYLPLNDFTDNYYNNLYITVKSKNIKNVKKDVNNIIKDIKENKYKSDLEITKDEINRLNQSIEEAKASFDDASVSYLEKNLKSSEEKLKILKNVNIKIISSEYNYVNIKQNKSIVPFILLIISIIISCFILLKAMNNKKKEINTLVNLGYGNFIISFKYIVYIMIIILLTSIINMLVQKPTLYLYFKLQGIKNININLQTGYVILYIIISSILFISPIIIYVNELIKENDSSYKKELKNIKIKRKK